MHVIHSADMQFQGQSHILGIPLETATPGLDELRRLFEAAYWDRFEVELPEIRAVLVNLHTAVLGRRPGIELAVLAGAGAASRTTPVERAVRFLDGRHPTPILGRESIAPGATLEGPAIIEQLDTTTALPPGFRAVADEAGNLIVDVPVE